MMTRIEFRCEKNERELVEEDVANMNLTKREYFLYSTIYKKGRSSLNVVEKACIRNLQTYLNKIHDGIKVEESVELLIKECEKLCQYSKR